MRGMVVHVPPSFRTFGRIAGNAYQVADGFLLVITLPLPERMFSDTC
jgi:hypothetical protein